jgi:hypothetical protein
VRAWSLSAGGLVIRAVVISTIVGTIVCGCKDEIVPVSPHIDDFIRILCDMKCSWPKDILIAGQANSI